MTSVALLLIVGIIGIATIPTKLIKTDFVYLHGLLTLFLSTAVISSNINISSGSASVIVLISAIAIIIVRYFYQVLFFLQLKRFGKLMIRASVIALGLEFLVSRLAIDISGRNFDAIYAIQDGVFLQNSPITSSRSSSESNEVLPLEWSSSNADRYGLSYLISLIRFMKLGDGWTNAQSIYLVMLIITFYSIRSFFINATCFKMTKSNIYSVLIMLSPMLVFQSLYFMFGQTVALPTLVLVFFLCTVRGLKISLLYWAFLLSALMISYPAAFFPASGLFLIYQLVLFRNFKQTLSKLVVSGFLLLFTLTLSYGSNPERALSRIWNWIFGVINPSVSNVSETEAFRIPIFSQFTSIMGIPLSAGIISYPDFGGYSLIRFTLTNLLIILCILFTVNLFLRTKFEIFHAKLFLLLLVIPASFVIYGFISPNPYVVVKTIIWFAPILGIYQFVALDAFSRQFQDNVLKSRRSVPRATYALTTMRLLTLIVLFLMQIVTSWTYLSSLKSWDSFAQRPQKVDYRDFLEYEAVDIDSLAVVSATSEEAAWLAGLLSKNSFKAYSLGIGNQALGEALSRNCNLTYAQENFDQIDAIILDRRLSDISNIYMFENKAFDAIRHWDIYRAEELKFAVTVNGSGTFPPNVLSRHQSPIEGSSVIRWSSGQICLGVYSSRDIKVELNIRLARGPDLSAFEKWDIQAPIETSEYTFADGTLALEVSAKKGWNRVQIIQRGCENNPNYSRFFARPDDRKLCFAVGKISVNP